MAVSNSMSPIVHVLVQKSNLFANIVWNIEEMFLRDNPFSGSILIGIETITYPRQDRNFVATMY
jgi:hypothetical protein